MKLSNFYCHLVWLELRCIDIYFGMRIHYEVQGGGCEENVKFFPRVDISYGIQSRSSYSKRKNSLNKVEKRLEEVNGAV